MENITGFSMKNKRFNSVSISGIMIPRDPRRENPQARRGTGKRSAGEIQHISGIQAEPCYHLPDTVLCFS
jgi:hypothetical protein